MTKTITPNEAADMIHATRGVSPPTTFSVSFARRTDKKDAAGNIVEPAGTIREMVAFLGSNIKKGLAGGPAAYNPKSYNLIWVFVSNLDGSWEEDDKHRRSIAIDGIRRLKIHGVEYVVENPVEG